MKAGRYDAGARRLARRDRRERGCWLYVPAEELVAAGIDPYGPPPLYRTWGRGRRSVLVRLYANPAGDAGQTEENHGH